jgi:RNA polymerase sigma factor (TIGR02999 family)
MDRASAEVTRLLQEWSNGEEQALDRLVPQIHRELRKLAASYLRKERSDHTLQPTALVNEAFLKLIDQRAVKWQNRAHFFGIAAQAMRRILVDHARQRSYQKRGGDVRRVTLDEALVVSNERAAEVVALDDALNSLAEFDERKSKIVELRFFAGLSIEETAEILAVSPGTVMRDWTLAKAWLRREIAPN